MEEQKERADVSVEKIRIGDVGRDFEIVKGLRVEVKAPRAVLSRDGMTEATVTSGGINIRTYVDYPKLTVAEYLSSSAEPAQREVVFNSGTSYSVPGSEDCVNGLTGPEGLLPFSLRAEVHNGVVSVSGMPQEGVWLNGKDGYRLWFTGKNTSVDGAVTTVSYSSVTVSKAGSRKVLGYRVVCEFFSDETVRAVRSESVLTEHEAVLSGVEGLPEEFTENQMRAKINEIISVLGGFVMCVVIALLPLSSDAATVKKEMKGAIKNTDLIVTDVDLSGVGGGSVVESEDNPGYAANADEANHAMDAQEASLAFLAISDGYGNCINDTYAKKKEVEKLNERIGGSVTTCTDSLVETRIRNIPDAPAMRIVPEESRNFIPGNRWRVVRIGDDETVTRMTDAEVERILVRSARDLFFIDSISVSGGATNYVLKSLQSYLDATSPIAVGDLIGQYIPTNGGGTVTGEINVIGNLFVSGAVSMPNLVDVRTANIIANGFVVSNRVVIAESGLMVSNGVCHIKGAIAKGTIQATRVHIMDGGDVTFGGSPDNPTAGFLGMIEAQTLAKLAELGFTGNSKEEIGQTEGVFMDVTTDRFARLTDIVSHSSPNCVRPVGDHLSAGGTRASITLRNWCLNVPSESLSATGELRVFYPLHEIKDHLDMTQRLSFGIYFPQSLAATVSVKWDYAPDDGGFELRGETGNELDSISAGDYIWFQQIGPNTLSVTRKNFSNTINPIVND